MPDISLPTRGEKPYDTKLNVAIQTINQAVDATSEVVAETAAVVETGRLSEPNLNATFVTGKVAARVADIIPAAGGSHFVPPASMLAGSVGASWYTANKALGDVFRVDSPTLVRYVNVRLGGGTGNYQVYVARLNAAHTGLYVLGASAITAAPSAGTNVRADLGGNVLLVPGDYAVVLWCSAITVLANHGISNDHAATRSSIEVNGVQAAGAAAGHTLTCNPATGRWVSHITVSGPESAPQVLSLLGDSITANPAWWTRGNLLAGSPFSGLHNHGVGGNNTTQMLARVGASLSTAPDVLHVMGGTNDVGQDVPTATSIANLTAMYDAAVAAGATLIRYTVPPRTHNNNSRRNLWHALNRWIRESAADWPGLVIDWAPVLSDPADPTGATPLASLFDDGVHPNDAGQKAMSDYWALRVGAEVQTKGAV
ncbi:SGNH/GDSL hydrolase family protein [Microbacterium sp. zg-YB36]|uniref:SGNH/GDSL hydrolase family protein n=1 Tax=Microbacterium sp. zg-YB36 TaxID=2969407 RepID=UPI00214AB552|nr:SGNH/GDSL hydrolase family protein [Microbacterium sp. zg-YB36]MDL5351213.1 SGNH/GDSL hydrolase family protein [Microbacterium sp. zg-YB36]